MPNPLNRDLACMNFICPDATTSMQICIYYVLIWRACDVLASSRWRQQALPLPQPFAHAKQLNCYMSAMLDPAACAWSGVRGDTMSGTWDVCLDDPDLGIVPQHEQDTWEQHIPSTSAKVAAPPVGAGRGRQFTTPAWMTGGEFSIACNALAWTCCEETTVA